MKGTEVKVSFKTFIGDGAARMVIGDGDNEIDVTISPQDMKEFGCQLIYTAKIAEQRKPTDG